MLSADVGVHQEIVVNSFTIAGVPQAINSFGEDMALIQPQRTILSKIQVMKKQKVKTFKVTGYRGGAWLRTKLNSCSVELAATKQCILAL